jgi:cytochrome c oxidase subunit 2
MKYMRHFFIVGILIFVVTVLVSLLLDNLSLLPINASAQATPIDSLFTQHFRLIAFLFALIIVFMLYSFVVFRRRKGDTSDGDHFEGHTGLEITWTVIPLIIVVYFAYVGAQSLDETLRVDPQAMEVNVTGFQWGWTFEYPEFGITTDQLHLPKDHQILLNLTSRDVIHSFWVPEFRVKQDALPGEDLVRELRVTPTLIGEYKVRCAELCGGSHAYMESPVIVMEQADFDNWVEERAAASLPDNPAERGALWATRYGCVACHTIDGTSVVGPTWQGLFGHEVTLEDGTTVVANADYLRDSILNPNDQIVEGFQPNLMPPIYAEQLTDEQIEDLIAYIESLE